MKVALIFNPFSYKVHEENLRVVQKYFGLFPPLSLAWVASIIRDSGHDSIIIDARTLRLTPDDVGKRLVKYKPDIIGFMMTTYMFPETLEWIKYLKNYLSNNRINVKVLIGGYNLRVYPKESLSHKEIDYGCLEHAYYTVPALLSELEKKNPCFDHIPGLVWKNKDLIVVNPNTQKIDFNLFPFPARDLLPNELYAEFPTQRKNFTVMVTSLGCPHSCNFCEANTTSYSPRNPELVVKEIEECYNKYGIREIDFFDYQFTSDKNRVKKICELLIEKKIDIIWACRSRVDTVDENLLKMMALAGCNRIYWGIESSSQQVLDSFNKGITIEQIIETIKSSKKLNIQNLGFFLIGTPEETHYTVNQNIKFAKQLDLEYVQFSKLLAKPGTKLLQNMINNGHQDFWSDWVKGKEKDRELPRPWLKYINNDEINALAYKAYIRYHSRPLFLLRHSLECHSFTEFIRKVFAYLDMLLFQEKKVKPVKKFKAYSENIFKVFFYKFLFKRFKK